MPIILKIELSRKSTGYFPPMVVLTTIKPNLSLCIVRLCDTPLFRQTFTKREIKQVTAHGDVVAARQKADKCPLFWSVIFVFLIKDIPFSGYLSSASCSMLLLLIHAGVPPLHPLRQPTALLLES